jgi:hypothetical protein
MPLGKTYPQGFGSGLTYTRRYSISALVGLIAKNDDCDSACVMTKNLNSNITAYGANPTKG